MQTLTKVYQTSVNVDSGNCFSACLTSLTGLPIDTIPLFRGKGWFKVCADWLFERGFQLTSYSKYKEDSGYYIVGRDAFFIKGVGWRCHSVIYKADEEAHNPISNRSHKEIMAVNKADGINESDILDQYSGILYTMVMRSINI